jgi:hypothetical protein
MMKIKIAGFSLAAVLVVPFLTHDSFGENFESIIEKNGMYAFVKIQVRNQDGQLVTYLESDRIYVKDPARLNAFLDMGGKAMQKSLVTIDGRNFEVIHGFGILYHEKDNVISKNFIATSEGGPSSILAFADHDGYPVSKGYKVTSVWTIVRPVH